MEQTAQLDRRRSEADTDAGDQTRQATVKYATTFLIVGGAGLLVFCARQAMRLLMMTRRINAGAVSERWLSDKRRDEGDQVA